MLPQGTAHIQRLNSGVVLVTIISHASFSKVGQLRIALYFSIGLSEVYILPALQFHSFLCPVFLHLFTDVGPHEYSL